MLFSIYQINEILLLAQIKKETALFNLTIIHLKVIKKLIHGFIMLVMSNPIEI